MESIPETAELASPVTLLTIKKSCEKHGINLDAWLAREGCTIETLTADNAALILRALNERYGDADAKDIGK